MIGLEFVCKVFIKEQKELAEMLKIAPPNISAWLKGTREIPTKYLPELSKVFSGLSIEYFQKELTYVDELKIQIYYIEKALKWDERQEPFEVGALDDPDTLVIDETYDLYEDKLKYLYYELNKTLKIDSYQDRINSLFEKLGALDNGQRAEIFKEKNAEDFIMGKLNSYLDFLVKFQVKDITVIDTIVNYFVNYHGIEHNKWNDQDLFPNEKKLAFYHDLEQLLTKHKVI
jgi:transcriptional regulator with XRE-family HTH domain